MKKNKGGRPTKIDEKVLHKLEEAFSQGFSDIEACLYAEIGTSTLYNYCEKNPKFLERKEELKNKPLMRARININKALQQGDKEMSKWYAERKAKKEFSTRVEQEIEGNIDTTINIVRARKGD
jgi:uncharacterized protein YaiL (DUF2058 family)